MRGKEVIKSIFDRKPINNGFWLGNPTVKAKENYLSYYGISEDELTDIDKKNLNSSVLTEEKIGHADIMLAKELKSDLMWLSPELDLSAWQHPEGKPMFDVLGGKKRHSLGDAGIFAETENVADVEKFDWPNVDYLDFSNTIKNVDEANANGLAVLGGMWCPFFHIACDFFGMENYFMKMHTNPDVVLAVTEHIVDFYLQANKKCFDQMADKLTDSFFGNDLGSQLSCLVSPAFFDKFIKPFAKKLIDQMKSYHLPVQMHSCGAIFDLIPSMIEIGVDALHPLQAKATNMDAEKLAKEFKNDIIFVGGVDTQDLLPFGNPQQIRDEVRRLRDVFGENYIVSPSHEALLENVCIENVMAMSEAATE
ncbi:MAG: uroporphyrinogen decarboxylase family protein [Christensenellaceae bacterium]